MSETVRRKVLIVEDDRKTVAALKLYLEHDGYETLLAYDGQAGLLAARTQQPDLIVLDLMLPQVSGLDVCRTLRAESNVPIIMLTARAAEDDKLHGLDLGADDYVTKPFSPRELVARVRAVLRRIEPQPSHETSILQRQNLSVDLQRRTVQVRGQAVTLTPTEFKLLATFIKAPGQVFTRQELVERALGWDYDGLDRTVDAHIMNLRRKIEPERGQPSLIVTVFGVGYKFAEEARAT
ncbi:MAG TPA: response regulator transcription factor [Blastocatellia bacterium]|nr:response regulator transcription factor [Blastocatellia bacterium]